MDKFDKKLKEITEGLMSTQNEAIIESHFEHMNEGMPSKVKILNALKNMSAEEVAKKFNIRLADVKQIEKETMNESNDLSDEEIKDLATKYIELKMKLKNEPQFNRKVDINRELKTFLKNNPEIRGKDDTAQGINIFYKDRKVAGIKPQYAKKKVNLSYKRLKNDAIKFYI
jgi:hypothetical protein